MVYVDYAKTSLFTRWLNRVADGQTDGQTDRRKSDVNSGAYYVTLAKNQ